eukprot:1157593-Pelagomonas_calceolata.AAC.4
MQAALTEAPICCVPHHASNPHRSAHLLRTTPCRQASQSHTQPQWRDCRSQVTASTSADAGTAAPGVAQEGEAGAAAIALGPAGGDTKGTYTSAPEPSPGSKPAARGAHGAVASQEIRRPGACTWLHLMSECVMVARCSSPKLP